MPLLVLFCEHCLKNLGVDFWEQNILCRCMGKTKPLKTITHPWYLQVQYIMPSRQCARWVAILFYISTLFHNLTYIMHTIDIHT